MKNSRDKKKENQCNNIAKMFNECNEIDKAYICGFVKGINTKNAKAHKKLQDNKSKQTT